MYPLVGFPLIIFSINSSVICLYAATSKIAISVLYTLVSPLKACNFNNLSYCSINIGFVISSSIGVAKW